MSQVKPASKRNSQIQVRTFDIDESVLDKLMNSGQEKQASATFLSKQRARHIAKRPSSGVSPLSSRSQAELDRKRLSEGEVQAMFVGAPYFKVEDSRGRYRPQVVLRGNPFDVRLATDYEAFGHPSFAQCTLNSYRSEEREAMSPMSTHTTEAVKSGMDLVEVPSMLSEHGLDPGTLGFEHFLQLPLSDSMATPDEATSLDKRKLFHSDPEWLGLRELNMEYLIDRLTEIGELYTALKAQEWESPQPWNGGKIDDMGEELFGKLLSAELGTTSGGTGSIALKTQIAALQRVLNTSELWRDFSLVEWRIRVGQLLWASQDFVTSFLDGNGQPSERDFLLLQITLAAELLMRLYALEALSHSFPPAISQEDSETLKAQRTTKINWDLLLAERFLDNLTVAAKFPIENDKKAQRASMLSAITFFTAKETSEETDDSVQPILIAKNETQQLAGLFHFAETIQWPHARDVKTELESKLSKNFKSRPVSTAFSVYATPLSSPKFPGTPGTRTSFFGFGEQKKRPGLSRSSTTQLSPARNIAGNVENFEVGGWLSRSWLSGLVMPGEPASHFLISALLENSPQAITALGEEANLYGGFTYERKSFWSKSCVVGRVLAASKGTRECMGWVSVPGTDEETLEDGWVNVEVQDMPGSPTKPRIRKSEDVTRDSDPLHGQDVASMQAGDFSRPTDGHLVMGNEVRCHGLSFRSSAAANVADARNDADVISTSIASLTFSSPTNSRLTKVTVPLTYDVNFISSYPCHPKIATKPRAQSRVKPPSPKPSFEGKKSSQSQNAPADSTRPSKTASTSTLTLSPVEKELPAPPAHPLHIDYHFDIVPAATLLSMASESRPRALSSPTERKFSDAQTLEQSKSGATPPAADNNEDVVILDCRGAEDLELLARGWCAKVGENALIGKSGRTCLACCVREARALGICVVVRT